MIRWSEFSFASMIAGRNTRFSLVFHTEGLANDKIAKKMEDFGRELRGTCRPMLTVITPLCPQYFVDPLEDPMRTDFRYRSSTDEAERAFSEKLRQLSAYYDIGYHGHFFEVVGGRCRPVFTEAAIKSQFLDECRYLTDIGHRPVVYAGGWWFLSQSLTRTLASAGFQLDTTVNDIHSDSFSRPQPYPSAVAGQPFRLYDGLVEIPSVRSLAGLKEVLFTRRKMDNLVVLALHDYDLMNGSAPGAVSKLVGAFVRKKAVMSANEIAGEALARLENSGR